MSYTHRPAMPNAPIVVPFVMFAIFVTMFAAFFTHIAVCISTQAWILLLFGIFFFPVGVVHGFGSWLGVW